MIRQSISCTQLSTKNDGSGENPGRKPSCWICTSLAGKIKCLLTQVTRGHISSGIVVTRRPDLSRYSNNLAFKLGMVFVHWRRYFCALPNDIAMITGGEQRRLSATKSIAYCWSVHPHLLLLLFTDIVLRAEAPTLLRAFKRKCATGEKCYAH